MSIEQRLEDLTKAINELPNALAAVLANSANPLVAVAASQTTTDSKADPAEEKAPASKDTTKGSSDNQKSDADVAGRKTYVFDKTTKTGQIIEKGEELPQGDNYARVNKTKWEELAEKYGFDVETGKKVESNGAEDFDDLEEEAEEEGEQEESGSEDDDGDMGLGLDDDEDEGELDPAEVKKRMVRVMREVGREDALKLFKKVGARNFDEVKKEDLPKLYDLAGKVLKKAGN